MAFSFLYGRDGRAGADGRKSGVARGGKNAAREKAEKDDVLKKKNQITMKNEEKLSIFLKFNG